jgi:hypothetical protein
VIEKQRAYDKEIESEVGDVERFGVKEEEKDVVCEGLRA